jgi:hypothetical protein
MQAEVTKMARRNGKVESPAGEASWGRKVKR